MPDDARLPDARAIVVVPEPTDWLRPVLEILQQSGPVEVFAPWVLPRVLAPLGRRVGFIRRRDGRELPTARGRGRGRGRGWFTAAELITRCVCLGKTAANLRNGVRLRALVDRAAAHHIARGPAPSLIVAPSLSARRSFAQGRRMGSACLLIEDLPDFDSLVDGLDALALAHPQALFLRNHRPSPHAHARQRAERWQADAIGVRGRVAWHRIGAGKVRVQLPRTPLVAAPARGGDVLFAGPALARCGSTQLPQLLAELPGVTIRVLPGPRSEPPALDNHPRIRIHRGEALHGIGAVLSLSPLESHPTSVTRALDAGVPVVGTTCSTGVLAPDSLLHIEDSTPCAVAAALRQALAGDAPRPQPWQAPRTLAQYVTDSSRTLDSNAACAPSVRTSVATT